MALVSQQMAERRERILGAARQIIGDRGYEALTMRDLARAGRVTVPTIYNLIGSKEAVLLAAVEDQIERFVAGLASNDAPVAAERALEVVGSCVRELLRLPAYYRSLLMLLFTSDAAAPVRREVDETLTGALADALEGLRDAGDLAGWVDVPTLARHLRLQLQATTLQWAAGGIGAEALRAGAIYGAALSLSAATSGESQRIFRAESEAAQRRARRAPASARRKEPPRRGKLRQ